MSNATPHRPLVRSRRAVVSTGHPHATAAGCAVLGLGGNAVDAAVAAAYALMVVLPHACGPGGDAFLLVRRGDSTVAFNGSGAIPRGWDGLLRTEGAAAATVPGACAALDDVHREFGTLKRAEVFAAAIALARDGFPVTDDTVAAIARNRKRLATSCIGCTVRGPPGPRRYSPATRTGTNTQRCLR